MYITNTVTKIVWFYFKTDYRKNYDIFNIILTKLSSILKHVNSNFILQQDFHTFISVGDNRFNTAFFVL